MQNFDVKIFHLLLNFRTPDATLHGNSKKYYYSNYLILAIVLCQVATVIHQLCSWIFSMVWLNCLVRSFLVTAFKNDCGQKKSESNSARHKKNLIKMIAAKKKQCKIPKNTFQKWLWPKKPIQAVQDTKWNQTVESNHRKDPTAQLVDHSGDLTQHNGQNQIIWIVLFLWISM